jgi:hypothetical protein
MAVCTAQDYDIIDAFGSISRSEYLFGQGEPATAKTAPAGAGDIWTWIGLDVDTKLVASWYIDERDSEAAIMFIDNLAPRLASRAHLTSDGHRPYLDAPCVET